MKAILKTVHVVLASVLVCGTSGVNAQEQIGVWQGTLKFPNNGPNLRLVLRISQENGAFVGQMYSIDQSSSAIPLSAIRFVDGQMQFGVPAIGASYAGNIAVDGMTAAGTYTQGEVALPLTLRHVSSAESWTISQGEQTLQRMNPSIDPGVEIATVKLTPPNEGRTFLTIQSDRVVVVNMSVAEILSFAYGLHRDQIANLPGWASTSHYNVTVKADVSGQPNVEQMKSLLRKVIMDRFSLRTKNSTRLLSVYLLEAGALKLKSGSADATPALYFKGPGHLVINNASMDDLCQILQAHILNRAVLNRTNRAGRWNGELLWSPDTLDASPADQNTTTSGNRYPSIFTAIREELGVNLVAAKTEAPILVVSEIHPPQPN